MLTVRPCATSRGSFSGASIVANVSPGTPATANRPLTRSGCRKASSNIVLTPIDQPMTGARSMPKWSITDSASSTNASMPQCAGSSGRSEPPVPRWFHDTMRTPQSGRRKAGQVQGPVPSPLHSTTVGPSMTAVGVVGPGGQARPVVGEHVVVGDARRGGDARCGGRHASDCAGAGVGSRVGRAESNVSALSGRRELRSRGRGVRAAKNASTSSRSARRRPGRVLAIIALRRAPCWDCDRPGTDAVEDEEHGVDWSAG